MSFNEFYDYDDHFGLFEQETEPFNFMTLDDYTSTYLTMTGLGNENTTYPNSRTGIVLPQTSIKFRLSENKTLYERKAYTFMILVGDIGGFTGAIIGLPAYFLNWYSSRMFGASIYE